MKAKITSRIVKERKKLEDVIPLETPIMLMIDPMAGCNFKCKFCFHALGEKNRIASGKMEMDLFKKIILDIEEFPDLIDTIKLYKDGEPLLNPDLPKMIKYIKEKNAAKRVEFTTNASLLTEKLSDELIESGLDRIIISIEGVNAEKYKKITGVKIDFSNFVKNIENLYQRKENCVIHIKGTNMAIPKEDEREFYQIFGNISDEIFIEKIAPTWLNTDFSSLNLDFKEHMLKKELSNQQVCPYLFYSLSINVDGSVGLCHIDWGKFYLLGDLKKEKLKEIWHGKKINQFRKLHLEKKKSECPVCKECNFLKYAAYDNIDDYAEDLLEKYKKRYSDS